MKRGVFSLRLLRWKLTLGYVLTTVAAVVLLELVAFSALAAFVYSSQLTDAMADDMRTELAPRLAPKLAASQPDPGDIREEIRGYAGSSASGRERPRSGTGGFAFSYGDPTATRFFVVDEDRTLLARYSERGEFSGEVTEGERFDAGRFAGLSPLLDAALGGQDDAKRSSGRAEGRMLAAVPLREGGDDGRAVGALVSVAPLPGFFAFAGRLLPVMGVGAVALAVPAAVVGTISGFLTAWWLTRRLKRLAGASEAWSRGDLSATVEDDSRDELGQLSRELNGMAARLGGLMDSREELAALEARNRFARDLHDSVKQQVYASSLLVDTARTLMGRDAEAADARLVRAKELLAESQKELDFLIRGMRPAALEDGGLVEALRDYAGIWSRWSETPVEVRAEGELRAPPETERALFRVAQEALANVARHSGARRAAVDLSHGPDSLTLTVADDGRGFDPARTNGEGSGLRGMRERVSKLGGSCAVESAPGGGTRVVCVCPLGRPGGAGGKDGSWTKG